MSLQNHYRGIFMAVGGAKRRRKAASKSPRRIPRLHLDSPRMIAANTFAVIIPDYYTKMGDKKDEYFLKLSPGGMRPAGLCSPFPPGRRNCPLSFPFLPCYKFIDN